MKKSIKVLVVGAVLLVGGLVFGLGCTVIGMMWTFSRLGSTQDVSPDQLGESLVSSFMFSAIGIPVAIVGFCLIVGGSIAYLVGRERDKFQITQEGSAQRNGPADTPSAALDGNR